MGGGSNDMSIFDGILQQTCSDKTCGMGHVNPKDGTDLISYLAHSLIIPFSGICRSATDDKLRFTSLGFLLHLIIVDHTRFRIEAVSHSIVKNA